MSFYPQLHCLYYHRCWQTLVNPRQDPSESAVSRKPLTSLDGKENTGSNPVQHRNFIKLDFLQNRSDFQAPPLQTGGRRGRCLTSVLLTDRQQPKVSCLKLCQNTPTPTKAAVPHAKERDCPQAGKSPKSSHMWGGRMESQAPSTPAEYHGQAPSQSPTHRTDVQVLGRDWSGRYPPTWSWFSPSQLPTTATFQISWSCSQDMLCLVWITKSPCSFWVTKLTSGIQEQQGSCAAALPLRLLSINSCSTWA